MEANLDKVVRHNDEYFHKMAGRKWTFINVFDYFLTGLLISWKLKFPLFSALKQMYGKYGSLFKELGEVFETCPLPESKSLTTAVMSTGKTYAEIADVYEAQVSLNLTWI